MKVTSTAIKGGMWERKYGKFGKEFIDYVPVLSIPFAIHNPPQKIKSFAAALIDDDAVAVCGHPWIHWLIANLKHENVGENESQYNETFVQGKNSWGVDYYGGMAPPNAPHRYDMHVYALDIELVLNTGFTHEDLKKAMKGHILESYTLSAMYSNK